MRREKTKFMTGAAMDIPSGILYLKKLMMKAEVDLRAMASHIRENLRSLDMYMCTTANSNTSTFNDYICGQLAALQLVVRLPTTSSTTCSRHTQEWIVRNSEISSRTLDGTGNAIIVFMTPRSS
jgi:hypothetical protein